MPYSDRSVGDWKGRLDEQTIARAAESRLKQTSEDALHRVSCEFQDGAIFLRGVVPTFHLRQVAHLVVANMEGVTRIVNRIEVSPRTCCGRCRRP
jgi:osmotically-inducible protein OsmY